VSLGLGNANKLQQGFHGPVRYQVHIILLGYPLVLDLDIKHLLELLFLFGQVSFGLPLNCLSRKHLVLILCSLVLVDFSASLRISSA
jgi:hypothetical protein